MAFTYLCPALHSSTFAHHQNKTAAHNWSNLPPCLLYCLSKPLYLLPPIWGLWEYWSLMAVVWDQLKDTLRNNKDLHTIQKQKKKKKVIATQARLLISGKNSFPLFSVFSTVVFSFISWEWVNTHTTYLINIELRLSSWQLSVTCCELSNEIMAVWKIRFSNQMHNI